MPATSLVELANQLEQLEGAGVQVCSHLGDVITQAGEGLYKFSTGVFLGVGEMTWNWCWHVRILYFAYCTNI